VRRGKCPSSDFAFEVEGGAIVGERSFGDVDFVLDALDVGGRVGWIGDLIAKRKKFFLEEDQVLVQGLLHFSNDLYGIFTKCKTKLEPRVNPSLKQVEAVGAARPSCG